MSLPLIVALIGFSAGFGLIWVLRLVIRRGRRKTANREAEDILSNANLNAEEIKTEQKRNSEAYKDETLKNFEHVSDKINQNIAELEEKYKEKKSELDEKLNKRNNIYHNQLKVVEENEAKLNSAQKRMQLRRDAEKSLVEDLIRRLEEKSEKNISDIMSAWSESLEEEAKLNAVRIAQHIEGESDRDAERMAKKLCGTALNRFARPYCSERGIGYLNPPSAQVREKILGPNGETLKMIEKACGVDLNYDEKNDVFNLSGFDPVRRELGRSTVDRLMKERHIDEKVIERTVERCKKELFKKIRRDGNRISNELKVHDLHPEVRDMMGALRYRYSFTQNQHYHCAEVGYLCGLLSAELGLDLANGRRAGLLHDIGKSMDHSIEGGHAVIGADFIEKHGEKEEIVHAVRAHHFDEMPSTDLAYLVIAADAMSGARPGARRSTAASYTQKMHELQVIASGFEGVTDTHILSAGREVRVMVNGKEMDDLQSLSLSKDIAKKIEEDMSFPGQIKVTVVRETQAVEIAK